MEPSDTQACRLPCRERHRSRKTPRQDRPMSVVRGPAMPACRISGVTGARSASAHGRAGGRRTCSPERVDPFGRVRRWTCPANRCVGGPQLRTTIPARWTWNPGPCACVPRSIPATARSFERAKRQIRAPWLRRDRREAVPLAEGAGASPAPIGSATVPYSGDWTSWRTAGQAALLFPTPAGRGRRRAMPGLIPHFPAPGDAPALVCSTEPVPGGACMIDRRAKRGCFSVQACVSTLLTAVND